jgi:hypothetical protein
MKMTSPPPPLLTPLMSQASSSQKLPSPDSAEWYLANEQRERAHHSAKEKKMIQTNNITWRHIFFISYSRLRNRLRQNTLSQGVGPTFVSYQVIPASFFAVLSKVQCKGIFPMYLSSAKNNVAEQILNWLSYYVVVRTPPD